MSRVVIALTVLVACLSMVFAFTEPDVVARDLTIVQSPPTSPHAFEVLAVRASLAGGAVDIDAVDFLFTTNWVPRMVLRYFQKDTDLASLFFGRWALWKIIEYQENTSSSFPGYEPGVDTYVSGYHLWLRGYSTMTYGKTVIGSVTVHKLCTWLQPFPNDTQAHPEVQLCIHTADSDITVNNTDASPNKLKFSLYIANYPYQASNSRLAVKSSFDSLAAIRQMNSSDATYNSTAEDGIVLDSTTTSQHRALTSWTRTVSDTGTNCSGTGSVVRSVVYTGQDPHDVDLFPFSLDTDGLVTSYTFRIVYHSFITDCQPASVLWDPDFGISDEPTTQSAGVSLLPAVSMLVLLLAALLL